MEAFLKEAIAAAQKAAQVHKHYQDKGFLIETKSTKFDLVTTADKEAEKCILDHLLSAFPDHSYLAEETGKSGESSHCWIIDPVDGTVNYAHGFPFYCVSIGLEIDGEIAVGVILDTLRDELFTAVKGKGAYLNGEQIHVSSNANLSQSLLSTGFSYCVERRNENLHYLVKTIGIGLPVRRGGSAALDLAYVACGRLEGYWELKLAPWDVAAGSLILREAGGLISDLDKRPFSIHTDSLIATNGLIHDELLRVLESDSELN